MYDVVVPFVEIEPAKVKTLPVKNEICVWLPDAVFHDNKAFPPFKVVLNVAVFPLLVAAIDDSLINADVVPIATNPKLVLNTKSAPNVDETLAL